MLNHTQTCLVQNDVLFLFLARYACTTRYEESCFSLEKRKNKEQKARFSLEKRKNKEQKARFARAPHYNLKQ